MGIPAFRVKRIYFLKRLCYYFDMEEGKSHFCGHCGSPLEGGSVFCGKCGTKVESIEASSVIVGQQAGALAQATQQPQPSMMTTQGSTKGKGKAKFFVIGGVTLALVVALIFLVPLLVGTLTPKTRTMMVYMIGSNLETKTAAASTDIIEMEDAKFNTDDTKVLVYTGGAKEWQLDGINSDENAVFEVTPSGITKVKTFEQKSMVDPSTLTEFVDFAYENYDTNFYDLVLWDHAGGPIIGFGEDELFEKDDAMGLKDLGKALEDSKLVKDGKKLEFVGFDACLMGGIEIAMALRGYSNYMIASEESEPNEGWNYNFLRAVDKSKSSEDVAKQIVSDFADFYGEGYPYDEDMSLSAIDLSKIEQVAETTGDLFERVNTEVTAKTFSQYSRVLTRKKVYGYNGRDSESFDLVDLKDLVSSLADLHPDEVARVNEAIEAAVLYSESNIEYTNGISVYFPTNNKQLAKIFVAEYRNVTFSDKYYDFLKKYSSFIGGKRLVERDSYNDLTSTVSDDTISVELPSELLDNYQSAKIAIYRKIVDEKVEGEWYLPVYQSSEVVLDGNVLKATTNNLQFMLKVKHADGTEEHNFVTMIEKERNAEYAEYTIFGVLGIKNEETIAGFDIEAYELTLKVDKENNVEIKEIREHTKEGQMPSKRVYSMDEILWIDFLAPSMNLDHDTSGTDYGTEVSISKGDMMEFELVDLNTDFEDMCGTTWCVSSDEVYYRFKVYDTQGEVHWLDMAKVNI